MRILLDDSVCNISADSVGAAIAEASTVAAASGRMIVEVVVDGERWTQQQLESQEKIANIADEVRMTSADPRELVSQTFEEAASALNEAGLLQKRAAELLQQDDVPAAMEHLNQSIAIWASVQQALTMGLELTDIDLEQPLTGMNAANGSEQPSTQMLVQELNHHLHLIRQSLENQDTVALGDILLYEFPPVVSRWQLMLTHLQALVRESC